MMMRRYRAMSLSAVPAAALMLAGCGPSTTNEENLGPRTPATGGPEIPVFKTYGERQQYEAEQKAKALAASKENSKTKGKANTSGAQGKSP